jgi:hypothetical protein
MKKQRKTPAQSQTVGKQADALKYAGGMVMFDQVFARRFQLVDSDGHFRGGLGFSDQGFPILALMDDHPKTRDLTLRAELTLTEKGPALILNDQAGRRRVVLAAKDTGVSSLSFWDEKGRIRFCADLETDGKIQAVTFDSTGREWGLVRQPIDKRPLKQTIKAIEAATNRDGKRGFIRAINETLGVYDHVKIERLWLDAVKKGKKGTLAAKTHIKKKGGQGAIPSTTKSRAR